MLESELAAAKGVSIHAPAWGATELVTDLILLDRVSIHAPAWGATCTKRSSPKRKMFQSTPPRGGRLYKIITSVKVASFNPRPRVGGDTGYG